MRRAFINSTILLAGVAIIFSLACGDQRQESLPEVVDFNFHVRPILSDKCFKCHGPDADERQADLRLDVEAGLYQALQDVPDQVVVKPGDAEASALIARIFTTDSTEMMPPPESNLPLSDHDREILKRWVEQGATYKKHWAFIPPELPDVPTVAGVNHPIDAFIQKKLMEIGLTQNKAAKPEALLKRLSLDLTGLPPSPEMQSKYIVDGQLTSYEDAVDELISSRHYGEKMALHWLDVARYADSHGYQDDGLRTMWPWRDWVIHAFNSNYPYDQFVTWQLAGDLLPDPSKEMLLATGFNRNHKITQEGGVIDEEYRVEYVTDRTNTFGKAFLAITFECAKCHDHKYDPIAQEDYFSTYAFFNQVPEKGIVGTIDASFADPPNMEITQADLDSLLSFVNKQDTAKLEVMIMQDSAEIRNTYVLHRGAYDAPAEQVFQGLPKAIMSFDTARYVANRLGLAEWLLSEENPLTSRVFVNRLWQEFFGRGLVRTSGDFGMQGDLPSHPELLDWLAVDFRSGGWDIKRFVKQVVMSSTYRQSAQVTDRMISVDPDNLYFARAPRIRLPAEHVRDYVLSSSGLLHAEIGGPSVKPYEPSDIWSTATSGRGLLTNYIQDRGDDLYRRGMYTFIKRTIPPPTMLMFDASNRDQCEVQRVGTNTPLQALAMLNDETVLEASRVLAERLLQQELVDEEMLVQAGQRILCRMLEDDELTTLLDYLEEERLYFASEPKEAAALVEVGEYPFEYKGDVSELAAVMQLVLTMYNLEETITKS